MTKKSKSKPTSKPKSKSPSPAHSPLATLLGSNVHDRRTQIGMTQETLASTLDVTPLYVSAIENGRRLPSLPLLIKLASAIGSSLNALVESKE
jgi:transcriptional regulator with XRE-family HTH domain